MPPRRGRLVFRLHVIGLASTLLALAACGSAEQVATQQVAGLEPTRLARPVLVVVRDFQADPHSVLLDTGVGAAFVRSAGGVADDAARRQAADHVREALIVTLSDRIRFMGLETVRAAPGLATGPYVLIDGHVQTIDQGDSTSRRLLGFRQGQSHVRVVLRVSYVQPGASPLVIGVIAGSGESGWAPGMALDLGFGVATGTVLTSLATSSGTQAVSYRHGSADADAAALGRQMADELGGLFARQGWISTSVLRYRGLPAKPIGASARPAGLAAE